MVEKPSALKHHIKPVYSQVNVRLTSPPGVYYSADLAQKTQNEQDIISLVRARIFSLYASHDATEQLNADLQARFPKSTAVEVILLPNFSTISKKYLLWHARCTYNAAVRDSKTGTIAFEPEFRIITSWPVGPPGHGRSLEGAGSNVILETTEIPMPQTADGLSLHPSFDIHQKLKESITVGQDAPGEATALELARLTFDLADKQYGDKRLTSVRVSLVRRGDNDNVDSKMARRLNINRHQYEQYQSSAFDEGLPAQWHRAYIALGSNIGDRIAFIEAACREMTNRGLWIKRTSNLYETKAMYLEDQQSFINGACEIDTTLSPLTLLDTLKEIENILGRKKTVENGPRTVDLDILMYDKHTVENERLSIPHKRMFEREFVLKPLCDIIPDIVPPLPNSIATFREELDRLPVVSDPLFPLTPLKPHMNPIRSQKPSRPTQLMAILNLTPDSFSDGGLHSTSDPISMLPNIKSQVTQTNPITILDIGGQSTRPHAHEISAEDEISRILPTIKAVRSDKSFQNLAISIDTYRASVATAAIEAGADIVNDVSAGQLDPNMLPTIAKLGCTCVLMHMRGTPDTMNNLTDYPNGIIEGVGNELLARVREAEKAGVRRWRIMLDPGIGFAKTQAQNLELLRRFSELRDFEGLRGFPWVVGASRKGFIGKITGVDNASERTWGTAATIAAAVQGGADVVRVHDVKEMGEVVKMADAIWRV